MEKAFVFYRKNQPEHGCRLNAGCFFSSLVKLLALFLGVGKGSHVLLAKGMINKIRTMIGN